MLESKKDNEQNPLLRLVANNIKTLRERKHLTQKKLAEKTKLSVNTIVKLENVKNNDVSLLTLAKLANQLQCSLYELLSETPNENNRSTSIKNNIYVELRNSELHFLQFVQHMIRQVKKLENETKRRLENNIK